MYEGNSAGGLPQRSCGVIQAYLFCGFSAAFTSAPTFAMSAPPHPSAKRVRSDDGDSLQQLSSRKRAVRKRAAVACEECRIRKRRCDGAVPACGGCAKRMSECVYSADVEARAWHSR